MEVKLLFGFCGTFFSCGFGEAAEEEKCHHHLVNIFVSYLLELARKNVSLMNEINFKLREFEWISAESF